MISYFEKDKTHPFRMAPSMIKRCVWEKRCRRT